MRSNTNHLKCLFFVSLLTAFSSCKIDNIKPSNALTEENVVRNEATAQYVLNGVYNKWRDNYTGKAPIFLGLLSNELDPKTNIYDAEGLATNSVTPDNAFVSGYYSEQYALINQANWLIESLQSGKAADMSEAAKNEMVAEARCQRAMAHFNLLRTFGQFYDVSSKYGIVVRLEPARGLQLSPRSGVRECYDAIIADLQFAADNGPTGVQHRVVSRTTASAYLAKVYLYAGNFSAAESTALKVMNNTDGYALENNYKDIFTKRFDSKETFFSPFADGVNEKNMTVAIVSATVYSASFEKLANDQVAGAGNLSGDGSGYDPRFRYAYAGNTKGPYGNGKYPYFQADYSGTFPVAGLTTYQLRMGEIYLIHAEAKARLTASTAADAAAIQDVNVIRARAGSELNPIAPVNKAALLEAIRQEKLLELFDENGEPWFDLVRFDRMGDLSAAAIKPTVTNPNKLMLPLGLTILAGNNNLLQAPGY